MSASSVVIRGIDARTFSEMESFVKDLEARPVERLLRDLPQLADLPMTKVSLVSYVMYTKFRAADAATAALTHPKRSLKLYEYSSVPARTIRLPALSPAADW